ncbi:cupin domain-containing protein [Mycolicibacterium smegmatis]|nr:cupin domain-containing protein [Mycolicibacterium smegmatis]ABK71756.1 cupin domain protein [Mycolicibacterium smegmatis MC2 155]AIU09520.1 cupin [Mycolicibacterium smegmatis MC2 155]AIU16145.1 cupin [Mycolicibacterium smegmatis]AIU22768.1 cupin [Mycolicibacterium smegmatis]MBE9620589.1 cupin domain-containing protein [Mycolicibacterium smegmatis]
MLQDWADPESGSTITVIQEVRSPHIPAQVAVITVLVNHPPGARGAPPHRLPGGPAFGYMIAGEMLFERDGEPARVLRAGDAFWGPGGDVIHYQDTNLRTDIPCSFVLTMLRDPALPLLERVDEQELGYREPLRVTKTGDAVTPSVDDVLRDRWHEVTRELVLAQASATLTVDDPQHSHPAGSISITLTGKALGNDLLLADAGRIALDAPQNTAGDGADPPRHPMRVIPMRLDILSELPTIRVSGRGMTESTQLRLVVELAASDPHNATTSVLKCELESVHLDPERPHISMDFHPQNVELHRS